MATQTDSSLAAARAGDADGFGRLVAPFKRELKAHCYRMSGSLQDAEDLLQDSLLRAWKGLGAFEGRSSVRTWLYTIATNTCLNALESKKARALPLDLGPPGAPTDPMSPQPELGWLEPCPPELYATPVQTPEARYTERESVALAFMAALQLLPARQRALLILQDVLGWSAADSAELLGMTSTAVHSALQRARTTLEERRAGWSPASPQPHPLLEKYLRAWEAADLQALIKLLQDDATLAMPPIPVWLRGASALEASMQAMVFSTAAPGDFRIRVTEASGVPALAIYQREGETFRPYALQLLQWRGDQVSAITAFLDRSLFERLGLPATAAAH